MTFPSYQEQEEEKGEKKRKERNYQLLRYPFLRYKAAIVEIRIELWVKIIGLILSLYLFLSIYRYIYIHI